MMTGGRVLVVGGGIGGLSTAWALARRGIAVTLFEQGPLPNPRAASFDEHRIIRHVYGAMEHYARLMPAAFACWERMWTDLGERHYQPVGALYCLRHDDDWCAPALRSLDALGIGYREIASAQLAERLPMLRTDGIWRAIETEGAGMLFPARILTGLVGLLGRLGVRLHSHATVSTVDPVTAHVVADGVRHAGDAVVVAAGAWSERLVPSLHRIAVPSRQAVLYLAPPAELAAAWERAPAILNRAPEGGTYTLPPRFGTRLKIGDHSFSMAGDPDDDRVARPEELGRLHAGLRLAFRDADRYAVLERRACYYTVAEEERFLIRSIGPASWALSACSGHGFKMGPLMGEGIAAVIAGERDGATLPDWAAGRVAAPLAEAAA